LAASKKYRFRREAEGEVITGWRGTMTICGNVPGRPTLQAFAGIWTEWNGVRGTKANPVEAGGLADRAIRAELRSLGIDGRSPRSSEGRRVGLLQH
jgi:hypothetical protein